MRGRAGAAAAPTGSRRAESASPKASSSRAAEYFLKGTGARRWSPPRPRQRGGRVSSIRWRAASMRSTPTSRSIASASPSRWRARVAGHRLLLDPRGSGRPTRGRCSCRGPAQHRLRPSTWADGESTRSCFTGSLKSGIATGRNAFRAFESRGPTPFGPCPTGTGRAAAIGAAEPGRRMRPRPDLIYQ